jgi:hypothetical protein
MGPIVAKYVHNRHVVCFQEVHGNRDDILWTFSQWLPGWSIFVSGCLDFQGFAAPGSGGVVSAVCPNLSKVCSFEERILVDGRCLLLSLCSNSLGLYKRVHIINLHNFGLSGGQVSYIGQELDKKIQDNAARPKEEFGIIIDDFNFLSGDDRVFKVGQPAATGALAPPPSSSGSHRTAWMKFLSRWTEVVQPFPTHFDPKGNTLSKLDRAFISCPSSFTLKLNIQCSVVGKPEECFANFESDHAPLALCFGRPIRLKIGELPIPRWICKHPNFKYHLNLLIDSVCILDLEVSHQL